MILLVKIEKGIIKLVLRDGKNVIDGINWPADNDLSQNILPNIQDFLKKNKSDIKDLEKAELESDIEDNFTTYRIVRTVVDSINFAVKMKK